MDLFFFSIKVLPPMVFENLNSLETLSIQNNKLTKLPEEIMEPLMDSLRVVDITGEFARVHRFRSMEVEIPIFCEP